MKIISEQAVSAEFLCLLHQHFPGCAVFMADDVHALLLEVYLPAVKREDALFVLATVCLHGFYA